MVRVFLFLVVLICFLTDLEGTLAAEIAASGVDLCSTCLCLGVVGDTVGCDFVPLAGDNFVGLSVPGTGTLA